MPMSEEERKRVEAYRPDPAKMERQRAEFDAMAILAKRWAALQVTPIVDDDYPEVRHYYENAMTNFVDAITANGRVDRGQGLTFARVRAAQLARTMRWHADRPWSGERYLLAAVGEIGEMANAVKKLWRIEDGIDNRSADPARQLSTREEVLAYVRKEAGDAFLYLDLSCAMFGFDLGEAVREVFNAKSEEKGFPEKL